MDFLKPATLWERIRHEVAKQEIESSVDLVSPAVLQGLTTSLSYRIQSEPSYIEGYYTRIDKYIMQFDLSPGDYIEALDTPVGFNIRKGGEIIFARQFKSQRESLLALPYTPRNLPFTAENALERLEPGDFVAFQARLSFVLSAQQDFLKGPFAAGLDTYALLSGEFMVHIFRMADNKMRVKLIAIQGQGAGANAGIDFSRDVTVLGIHFIDSALEKWINFTPLHIGTSLRNDGIIMFDYVFDLSNPDAAEAYNSLMLYKVQFKDVRVANPAGTLRDLTQELLTDLTGVEEVAQADAHRPSDEKRIDRIFKGSSEGLNKDAHIKFGINFWKFETGRAYGQNKILSYDKQNQQEYFLLDTLSRFKKTKILFGLFGEETLISSNLLFTADKDWMPLRFVTLTSSAEMKVREISTRDVKEIQRFVRDTIGESRYQDIPWQGWENIQGQKINGYFKQEVFFNPQALSGLPTLGPEALALKFKKFVQVKGRPRSRPFIGSNTPGDYLLPWIYAFTGDTQRVGQLLAVVVNKDLAVQERFNAFESLQKIPIWKERGIGFLMSFLPESKWSELLRYEMVLSAKDFPTLKYSFGSFEEEGLYRALMYIQNIIHNRSLDLRLYSNEKMELNGPPPID